MSNTSGATRNPYWMRAVSFAGLHRLLQAVGREPAGLRPLELNALALSGRVTLTGRPSPPKRTTLYHYRNTLMRLGVLARHGRSLRPNVADPDVAALLHEPAPADGEQSLAPAACERFAALVLKNRDCRRLLFDLFLPAAGPGNSVTDFRELGTAVTWTRRTEGGGPVIVFQNQATGHSIRYTTPTASQAVLYGLRYWARDQLALVDEYGRGTVGAMTLFPVGRPAASPGDRHAVILDAVRFLLSLRSRQAEGEWTMLSVSELISAYCETHRRPRAVLFAAIDWLQREWPGHIHLAPTSLGLATIAATSPQQENLTLRRYYKPADGPYISHLSFHRDVTAEPRRTRGNHVRPAPGA